MSHMGAIFLEQHSLEQRSEKLGASRNLGSIFLETENSLEQRSQKLGTSKTWGPWIEILCVFERLAPEHFVYIVLHHFSRRTTFGKWLPDK